MNVFERLLVCWAGVTAPVAWTSVQSAPINHYLVLDGRVVDKVENATLVIGRPEARDENPLLTMDTPAESGKSAPWFNIILDPHEKFYKAWYGRDACCYGTSHNGLLWNKPLLDLNPAPGGAKTSVLLKDFRGAGFLRDDADADDSRVFKLLGQAKDGVEAKFSEDGIKFDRPAAVKNLSFAPNSRATVLRDPEGKGYVAFFAVDKKGGEKPASPKQRGTGAGSPRRDGSSGSGAASPHQKDSGSGAASPQRDGAGAVSSRQWMRSTSTNFVEWSAPEPLSGGDLAAVPSFAAISHLGNYLAFTGIDVTGAGGPRLALASSADGRIWTTHGPALADPVQAVIPLRDEVRVFFTHGETLNLATLRPDGFVGYAATRGATGSVMTKPVAFPGMKLRLTADVGDGGSVTAALLDDKGRETGAAGTLDSSATNALMDVAIPRDAKTVRFKFTLKNATLYAFSFGDRTFP